MVTLSIGIHMRLFMLPVYIFRKSLFAFLLIIHSWQNLVLNLIKTVARARRLLRLRTLHIVKGNTESF